VIADCDLRVGLHAKRWFDAAGHYSRRDAFTGAGAAEPRPLSRPLDDGAGGGRADL